MARTASRDDLLQVCIQDLYAARVLGAQRLGAVSAAAGPVLARLVARLQRELAGEAEQLERSGTDLAGPENLWMAGIMDDAERDTRSIAPGALLDTAIVGAVRKAIAADAVSLETAVVLARALARHDLGDLLDAMRRRRRSDEEALRRQLHETNRR